MKKQEELISVIVPVYNVAGHLPRCFETIVEQTYQNLEIILVDDGSTDGSEKLCDELASSDSRTKVIHQQNRGLWVARNSGQRIAKGRYFLFVDSDDYLHLQAVEVMHKAINSGPRYDMAMINRQFTERLDEDVTSTFGPPKTLEFTADECLLNMFEYEDRNLFIYQWNKLYRRELIENLYCNEYTKGQDFDFNFRVYLQMQNAIWVQQPLYFYVQRLGSLCHVPWAYEVHCRCRIDMLFNNYTIVPKNKKRLRHLMLNELHPMMYNFMTAKRNDAEWKEICKKYMHYEAVIRKDFLRDNEFVPRQKLEWTLRIMSARCPILFDWIKRRLDARGLKKDVSRK